MLTSDYLPSGALLGSAAPGLLLVIALMEDILANGGTALLKQASQLSQAKNIKSITYTCMQFGTIVQTNLLHISINVVLLTILCTRYLVFPMIDAVTGTPGFHRGTRYPSHEQ